MTRKLISTGSQTSQTTITNPKFATTAGRKVVKAHQNLCKAYEDFDKQEAPKRAREDTKFVAERKAELRKKAKDLKFIRRQLAEKRAQAKAKGKLDTHTRLYIQQLKA